MLSKGKGTELIVDSIEFDVEIPSKAIGAKVMTNLKKIDQIAYVRFASVYKDFRDLSELAQEISNLELKNE